MKKRKVNWLGSKASKVSAISLFIIALIFGVTFIGGGTEDLKKLTKNAVENGVEVVNVATGVTPANASTPAPQTPGQAQPSGGVDMDEIKALIQQFVEPRKMNPAATDFKKAVVSDKLSVSEISYLKKTNNPVLVDAALVGAGTDKDYFMPLMNGLVEPMISQIFDNSNVALTALETSEKNKVSTLSLALNQLKKDKRWTPEERESILGIGYNTKTGIFLNKASDLDEAVTTEYRAAVVESFGSVDKKIASVANNLSGYKKTMKNRLRDGHFEGEGKNIKWIVGFDSQKIWP